jgi:hypothetical protein
MDYWLHLFLYVAFVGGPVLWVLEYPSGGDRLVR